MEKFDVLVYLWFASAILGTIALVIMVDGYLIALYQQTIKRLRNGKINNNDRHS